MSDETRTDTDSAQASQPCGCTKPASGLPPELVALIDDLPKWLDGVWKFMAITNSELYAQLPVGNTLMIQKLNQHTRRMRENALALQRRWGTPDAKRGRANAAQATTRQTAPGDES
jgi:hypothetical protein